MDPKQTALDRINQTFLLAQIVGMESIVAPVFELSYIHMVDLHSRANQNFHEMSVEKLNRWLGWMQASLMSTRLVTLEQLKQLNR